MTGQAATPKRRALLYAASTFAAFVIGGLGGVFLGESTYAPPSSGYQLPYPPRQVFEKAFATYNEKQRSTILAHVERALTKLPEGASPLEKAAAINTYLYQYFRRAHLAKGANGVELLQSGEAICGGAVATMAEMLYAIGVKGKYAYAIGGNAAHSMMEVFFDDGTQGLFDPYHGVLYLDREKAQPLSIIDINNNLEEYARRPPVMFTAHGKATTPSGVVPMASLSAAYTPTDRFGRTDYDFVKLFNKADSVGVANSGLSSFVNIELRPGDVIGRKSWKQSHTEPRPWTKLAMWEREPGDYLSWAYMLGDSALGYTVKHVYTMRGLDRGRNYLLELYIATAYGQPDSDVANAVVSVQPTAPFGKTRHLEVKPGGYVPDNFVPRRLEIPFRAEASEVVFVLDAHGILTLSGIELERGEGDGDKNFLLGWAAPPP